MDLIAVRCATWFWLYLWGDFGCTNEAREIFQAPLQREHIPAEMHEDLHFQI
jgi:hypothetical protein